MRQASVESLEQTIEKAKEMRRNAAAKLVKRRKEEKRQKAEKAAVRKQARATALEELWQERAGDPSVAEADRKWLAAHLTNAEARAAFDLDSLPSGH